MVRFADTNTYWYININYGSRQFLANIKPIQFRHLVCNFVAVLFYFILQFFNFSFCWFFNKPGQEAFDLMHLIDLSYWRLHSPEQHRSARERVWWLTAVHMHATPHKCRYRLYVPVCVDFIVTIKSFNYIFNEYVWVSVHGHEQEYLFNCKLIAV